MNLMPNDEFNERFVRALGELEDEEWEVTVNHSPHANTVSPSGIGNCVRQQLYKFTNKPKTNQLNKATNWSSFLGSHGQAIAAKVLEKMGYTVFDQEAVVDFNGIQGRVDGKLTGLDLDDLIVIWDSKLRNIFGLYGTKGHPGLANSELKESSPDIYLQMQAYIAATGAAGAILTVQPYDLSAAKLEATKKKVPVSPVYRVVVEPDEAAQKLALTRAQLVLAAAFTGQAINREADPYIKQFPCSYCEYMTLCLTEGGAFKLMAPVITL